MVCVLNQLSAQEKLPGISIEISKNNTTGTVDDFLNLLETQYSYTLSYNANQLPLNKKVSLEPGLYLLSDFFKEIFESADILVYFRPPNKIIISGRERSNQAEKILLRGYIFDKENNEALIGALITEEHSGITVSTNEYGYYYMYLPTGKLSLDIQYLGYKSQPFLIETFSSLLKNFHLESSNRLPEIIISDRISDRINHWNSGEIIDVYKSKEFTGILGDKDLINNVRIMPGVQSGGEGQSGLHVRGGGPDQNLVLLEGIPIYESSHTAGISSIFIEESIKEASFIKNGFPSRYGGRLSSVLDIHLKDGNPEKHEKSFSLGLPGVKMHFNGPVAGQNTTYNLSGRISWLDFYVNKWLRPFTKYDAINIGYTDLTGKITHKFRNGGKISLSLYSGSDRLELRKSESIDTIGYTFNSYDTNRLRWGNQLISLKWNQTFKDRLNINIHAGALKYQHRARSSYIFDSFFNSSNNHDELDVLSYADITDVTGGIHADYYLSDKHTLKSGIQVTNHKFNPIVKQSLIILEGEEANILDKDSTIYSVESGIYLEDNFKLSNEIFLYGGLHLSVFNVGKTSYHALQPRFKLLWTPTKNQMFNIEYSRMTQNIHLLVNSGLGLPSDLWVPSTEKIAPQNAAQFSISYSRNFNKAFYLQTSLFYKNFNNLIEYATPTDLFYFFVNDQNVVPVFNNSRDWERNIFTGKGRARGIELLLQRKGHKINGWAAATYSSSTRTFSEINEGKPFPYTYDRTWDLNSGLTFELSKVFSIGLSTVYGTGNAFSLATEEFDSVLGIRLLNISGRNNYRLPPFIQTSVNLGHSYKNKFFEIKTNLNIYNVFNRLNAYYIYVYKNPVTKDNILRKVSILPITPSINLNLIF